ncbi:glycosylase [Chitinophaga agrisoli]|uniref:Glycosylase n=1 Tax=Chitinophaga agrisoli TaxID=2607653 RepID=A0A5B2VRA4_9BACT|nr:glycosylase [Chitinophaga agrisoli]KAA2241741.1 glycosylase [Chitinophaga agrisoli]
MRIAFTYIFLLVLATASAQTKQEVPVDVMQRIYDQVKTPYKYGLVLTPETENKKLDCPSVFRKNGHWYMTYIQFDGRGYETWISGSKDLLHWETLGKLMSFSDTTDWDNNQKAGYIALQEPEWGGSYEWQRYDGKYWMSYIGGNTRGYEKGLLSIGMAYTTKDPTKPHELQRLPQPVLMSSDKEAGWWENNVQYKSTVLWDRSKATGHQFIMYYNAKGDSINPKRGKERIGMAVSDDMLHWQRFGKEPVLNHHAGITGDPWIQRINDVWVMFYFGAFWKDKGGAFNRFACSYDLLHWTDWTGDDLIKSSEPFDGMFAHKSSVVYYKGIVYHFYCAVNKADQRGIAVATSVDKGKSALRFGKEEKTK